LITATQSVPADSSAASITAPVAERSAEPSQNQLPSARSEKKEQRESPAIEKPSAQEKSLQVQSPTLPALQSRKHWTQQ